MNKAKKMNTIKLSDAHLRVINRALETYYRMRSGQIGMAIDTAYDHSIEYNHRELIEKMVRVLIIDDNGLSDPGASYSYNNDKLGDARIAYEIQCCFRQFLAVKNNDGFFSYETVDFGDPLKASDEPLPEIVDFKKYIDYNFSPEQSQKINKFHSKKQYKEAWDYVDSLMLNFPSGEKTELIPTLSAVSYTHLTLPTID
jgi:hypothetical protein